MLIPLVVKLSCGVLPVQLWDIAQPGKVDQCLKEISTNGEYLRLHDFKVVRGVQRMFVVFCVAAPEGEMVVPTDESVYVTEGGIEPSGSKDRVVGKFMYTVDGKSAHGSVEEKCTNKPGPGTIRCANDDHYTCCDHAREVTNSLQSAFHIAAFVKVCQQVRVERCSIPCYGRVHQQIQTMFADELKRPRRIPQLTASSWDKALVKHWEDVQCCLGYQIAYCLRL